MSSPLEQLQADVLGKLVAESLLSNINCKSLRKMRVQSELDVSVVYMAARNSKFGCGCVVMMPTMDVEHPNTPGPSLTVTIGVRVYEEPNLNLNANGTMQSAEEIATLITQLLHQFQIFGLCSLYAGKDAVRPVDSPGGTICYEALLRGQLPESLIRRVSLPNIDAPDLTVTLTGIEDGVVIYYTTDGSFPGANPAAGSNCVMYYAPFAVPSGTTLRWAGYKTNWNGSDVGQAIISRGVLGTEDVPSSELDTPEGGGIQIQ